MPTLATYLQQKNKLPPLTNTKQLYALGEENNQDAPSMPHTKPNEEELLIDKLTPLEQSRQHRIHQTQSTESQKYNSSKRAGS